jgi:hypothetical protein
VAEKWTLSYGWSYRRPGDLAIDFSARPGHVETTTFHSLEAALHYPERGTWQEIRDPAGNVVMVTGKGFDETACPNPSLCAKQILNTRFPGMYPDAEMDAVLDSIDSVSHDDGKTWSRIILGAKQDGSGKVNGHKVSTSASRLENLTLALGPGTSSPKEDTVEIKYGEFGHEQEEGIFTIYNPPPRRKPAGRIVIRKSALSIRQNKNNTYDIVIRKPDEKRVRVFAAGIEQSVIDTGRTFGITIEAQESARPDGLPRSWKPGLFKIACKERETENGPETITQKEMRGFVRGSLGIDRRLVDQTGYGGSSWKVLRWCLTHIPTGTGIVMCKARKGVEEIADGLRDAIPELTDDDADDVTEDIKIKARAVLEKFGISTTVKQAEPDPDPDPASVDRERIFMGAAVSELNQTDHLPVHITGSTPVSGPVIDPDRRFYVSVVDGVSKPRYGFLIGPFKLHQTALSVVDEVSRLTQDKYPWSHFYSFGTCSLPRDSAGKIFGVLNDEEGFREIYIRAFLEENSVDR